MKKSTVLLVCILFCWGVSAQDKSYFSELVPPSPDVAQLGTYGETQVGKYTGTANISVPLHTINFDGLQIPIQLSYQTGGIKVSQEATWVGLGWNLSANAVISRQTIGYDDLTNGGGAIGYLYSPNFTVPLSPTEEAQLLNNRVSSPYDTQPDIFTASIFGESVQFILPKYSGTPMMEAEVLDSRILKVYYHEAGNTDPSMQNTFEVINGQGFHFYFGNPDGNDDIRREYTTSFRSDGSASTTELGALASGVAVVGGQREFRKTTAWQIYKIKAPSGREIYFDYERTYHFGYPAYSDNYDFLTCNANGTTSNGLEIVSFDGDTRKKVGCQIPGFESAQLKKISGDFGVVDFILENRIDLTHRRQTQLQLSSLIEDSTSVKRLAGINVGNAANQPIKTIDFHYSYFNGDQDQDVAPYKRERYLRLKLDGVTIDDREYSFNYHMENDLPPKDSRDEDFWGYYNGKQNTNRIPSYNRLVYCSLTDSDYLFNLEGADRSSDFTYGKAGLLWEITYPTQGKSVFTYEGNRALVDRPTLNQGVPASDATDFSYNYSYLAAADRGIRTSISSGDEFTVTEQVTSGFNFEYTAQSSCGFNCTEPSNGSVFLELENLNTGEFIVLETYGQTGNGTPSYYSDGKILAPGNYKFYVRTYQQTACNTTICPPTVGISAGPVEAYFYSSDDPFQGLPSREFEVGGARITSVTNYGSNGSFINKKVYDYQLFFGASQSTGILMNELVYHSKYGVFDYTPENFNQVFTMTSGSPLSVEFSAKGSHIGYSFVEERSVDENGVSNGFMVTGYVNEKNEFLVREVGSTFEINEQYRQRYDNDDSSYTDVYYGNSYLLGVPPRTSNYKNGSVVFDSIAHSTGSTVRYVKNTYQDQRISTKDVHWAFLAPVNVVFDTIYQQTGDLFLPSTVLTKEYFEGELLTTTTTTSYETQKYLPRSSTTTSSKNNTTTRQETYYPFDTFFGIPTDPYINELIQQNRITEPVLIRNYENNALLSQTKFNYGNFSGEYWHTEALEAKGNDALTQRMDFISYDNKGNLTEYKRTDGTSVTYLWGYNDMYPVAKVENATYSQVTGTGINMALINNVNTADPLMRSELDKIRTHSSMGNAMVTTYTYKQGVGISSMTDPRGYTTLYEYDDAQRLRLVKDTDGYIVSQNEYHLKAQN